MPRLRAMGLSDDFVDALEALPHPIRSAEQLVTAGADELAEAIGLSRETIVEAQHSVAAVLAADFVRADKLLAAEEDASFALSTGCRTLDDMLGGGFLTGEVTELFGPAGCGKSQVCMSAATHLLVSTDASAIYIDTTSAVSEVRINALLGAEVERVSNRFEVDPSDALGRFALYNVFEAAELLATLQALETRMASGTDELLGSARLLVLDSITVIVAPLQVVGDGNATMCEISDTLHRLAKTYSLAVVLTNNVVSDRVRGSGTKAALGRAWTFAPDVQVALFADGGEVKPGFAVDGAASHVAEDGVAAAGGTEGAADHGERGAELRKCPRMPTPCTTRFRIGSEGLVPEAVASATPMPLPWTREGEDTAGLAGEDGTAARDRDAHLVPA
mmetsp:Transcript_5687/g.20401  ORF Transcript_5687/g.20401 Transcript_5687/m.20401 type:complete len:390 (-) Transcript_5687:51-1220(-)